MTGTVPVVSVVVATYGRGQRLGRLVAALEAQDLDEPFEVVVVDDGSRDGTWDVLADLADRSTLALRPLRHARNAGAAAARNTGWRAAAGELVVFTDDDCAPLPGWLRAMVAALQEAEVAQGCTIPDPAQAHLDGPFSRTLRETSEGLYPTANVGYKRAALEQVGGFDEGYTACEDTDLALRVLDAGGCSAWVPEALVHHDVHASDLAAYLREKQRWDGVPRIIARHPQLRGEMHSRWFWRASHPPALLAGLGAAVTSGSVRRRRPMGLLVGVGLVYPYLRFRLRTAPVGGGPRRRVAAIPLVLIADLYEVAVLARASVRHRTLVL